jgi:uncharacterized RmlC-like cupin family protein
MELGAKPFALKLSPVAGGGSPFRAARSPGDRSAKNMQMPFSSLLLRRAAFVTSNQWIALPRAMSDRLADRPDWKEHGIRIVHSDELDTDTPQTPGMTRAAAITYARVGAQKLWAGTVIVQPAARTGPHHHGELETVLYIVCGRARFRWGDRLEFVAEAGPGDFIYVPPFVPHQELNATTNEPVQAVVVRSGQEPIVVNLDIESPEPILRHPRRDAFHPPR